MDEATRDRLKWALLEREYPTFSDEELDMLWEEAGNDFNTAAYNGLIRKAENDTLQVSGLNLANSSQYFRRMAAKYAKRNSGVLST